MIYIKLFSILGSITLGLAFILSISSLFFRKKWVKISLIYLLILNTLSLTLYLFQIIFIKNQISQLDFQNYEYDIIFQNGHYSQYLLGILSWIGVSIFSEFILFFII
jgi:hypothetical protein